MEPWTDDDDDDTDPNAHLKQTNDYIDPLKHNIETKIQHNEFHNTTTVQFSITNKDIKSEISRTLDEFVYYNNDQILVTISNITYDTIVKPIDFNAPATGNYWLYVTQYRSRHQHARAQRDIYPFICHVMIWNISKSTNYKFEFQKEFNLVKQNNINDSESAYAHVTAKFKLMQSNPYII
eukprot:UN06760